MTGRLMTLRAVVFDFGNVVAFFDHRVACRQLAELSRGKMDADAIYTLVFGGGLEADYDSGRCTSAEFLDRVRRALHLDADDTSIARAWSDMFRPNEAVANVIGALKARRIRLVLGSNTNALHHDWFARQFADTLAAFDAQILSYQIGCRKPDRRFYEACLAAAGCAAAECAYVDDRADLIAAGRDLGLLGIVYTPDLDLAPILLS
jgi:glucose-1-phosphatase